MSDKLTVRKGTFIDAMSLRGRLREADQTELFRSSGKEPDQVILQAWSLSTYNRTICLNKVPIAIFGVAPVAVMLGSPWMVGSDAMKKPAVRMFIARNSEKYIRQMLAHYPNLLNFVDVDNDLSIKWLKWCGFKFYGPERYGPFGFHFYRFQMENSYVSSSDRDGGDSLRSGNISHR